jgi:hypothetical protein
MTDTTGNTTSTDPSTTDPSTTDTTGTDTTGTDTTATSSASDPTSTTDPSTTDTSAVVNSVPPAGFDEPAEETSTGIAKGDLVSYAWSDPSGDHTAVGLVVEVLTDPDVPDRVSVAWLEGPSGPLDASDVTQI